MQRYISFYIFILFIKIIYSLKNNKKFLFIQNNYLLNKYIKNINSLKGISKKLINVSLNLNDIQKQYFKNTIKNPIIKYHLFSIKKYKKKNIKTFLSKDENVNEYDKIYYELNYDNVEKVLNLIKPKLQADNGDLLLEKIENNNIFIKLLGNCVTCSSNSITISEVIKKTLKTYIRNEKNEKPNVIITNFDELTIENLQNCLDPLKPYFDFIKINVLISNLEITKENINNTVSLKFQSTDESENIKLPSNIRNEITERIKQKFPTLNVHFEN